MYIWYIYTYTYIYMCYIYDIYIYKTGGTTINPIIESI